MKRLVKINIFIALSLSLFSGCSKKESKYGKLNKIGDKLYEVTFDKYSQYYAEANEYYTNEYFGTGKAENPNCTCIYKDGFLMRNLDWYNKQNGIDICETIIRTTANEGRYATLGVMNNSMVSDETYDKLTDDQLRMLPFALADGINSEGLMFGQNTVPAVDNISVTYGTNPNKEDLVFLLMGREILDYCATVDEAIDLLRSRNCYLLKDSEAHIFVADKQRAVCVEFVNNEIVVIEKDDFPNGQTFCTNHYLFNGGEDTGHGAGYERDKIISENYDSINDWKSGMSVLQKVKYSNIYTIPFGNDFWYSEFHERVEYGETIFDFNKNTQTDDPLFLRLIGIQIEAYERQDDECWRTSHSSVYDSSTLTLHISLRENFNDVYCFSLIK